MAQTNFAALDDHQKMVWSRDVMSHAREKMFTARFTGTGQNSMIQRIPQLTKSERGLEAVINLVPDIEEDGVVGDNELVGNEAEMKAVQDKIQIDMLRNGVRSTGKMADQATVINFREQAKDKLSYWLADRWDQLSFLTLAGMSYATKNSGGLRPVKATGKNLSDLAYAADVEAPSSERYLVVQGDELGEGIGNNVLSATDKFGYKHVVKLQAYAKTNYVRGVRGNAGSEVYHLFLHPMAMSALKLDEDFINNARHAGVRGDSNTLWEGGDSYKVDGLFIHEFRHVPTTLTATATNKWGSDGNVNGCRGILAGAQALAVVDLDSGSWDERDHFDYGNNVGIAYGKIGGFKKPKYLFAKNAANNSTVKQDYGTICIDMAI